MTTRPWLAITLTAASVAASVALAVPSVVSAAACSAMQRIDPAQIDPSVVCVEQRLIELGYRDIVGPDDVYDGPSVEAVKGFQSSRGLHPDGIITSVTARQLGLRGSLAPAGSPRVTVIGDSTAAAIRWYDEANNHTVRYDVMAASYDVLLATESCRRLVAPSCLGRVDPGTGQRWAPVSVLPLMRTTLHGNMGEALVIMAGYDDLAITDAIDQIMAEAKHQKVPKVLWLNYRVADDSSLGPIHAAHNVALEDAKVRHPNLLVLDWNGYSKAQPATTQAEWFGADQIHITSSGAVELARFIKARLDAEHIEVCDASHALAGVPDTEVGTPLTVSLGDTGFVGMQPVRVLDTRAAALGGGKGKLQPSSTIRIDLQGVLPAGTSQAVLNVTAVNPCSGGYLTVFACGTRPNTSNLNYEAGRTTAALAMTLHDSGAVCIYTFAKVDLVVDLLGAFTPNGALFHPLGPVRWMDTRGTPAVFGATGPIAAGQGIDVPIAGRGGVPADATGVWINLTAAGSPVDSVWQAYPGPCGPPPTSSTVNVLAKRATATSTLIGLGANGGICVQAYSGSGHAIVDVSGWFGGTATGGLALRSAPPTRVIDTRTGPMPGANTAVSLATGQVGVFNTTAVLATGFGYVSAAPCGSTQTSSLVNTSPLETFANLGTAAPGSGGRVCFDTSVAAHLVVDQLATFVPPGS
ncbi:MAG: peptidoglycan-binding protein [Ilumatobacteraceae bacterium]